MRLHGDRSDREASAPTRVTGPFFKKGSPKGSHLRGTFTPSLVIVAFPRKKMVPLTFRPEFLGIVSRLDLTSPGLRKIAGLLAAPAAVGPQALQNEIHRGARRDRTRLPLGALPYAMRDPNRRASHE